MMNRRIVRPLGKTIVGHLAGRMFLNPKDSSFEHTVGDPWNSRRRGSDLSLSSSCKVMASRNILHCSKYADMKGIQHSVSPPDLRVLKKCPLFPAAISRTPQEPRHVESLPLGLGPCTGVVTVMHLFAADRVCSQPQGLGFIGFGVQGLGIRV